MSHDRQCKIMIMAGGTGGHVFPALAVANELLLRGCKVEWLGTQRGIEADLVPANNIPLHYLSISGVRGKGLGTIFSAPWKVTSAVLQAAKLLSREKPDVVLGMGGYASGPGGIAAKLLGIPLVIHEQNARPGTTNKCLAKVANRVLTAFPDVFPKALCIGNPVRKEIVEIPQPEVRMEGRGGAFKLLVLGGSLGAQAINELLPHALAELNRPDLFEVTHQAGKKHYETTLASYTQLGIKANVVAFIDDMAQQLAWADLVICRSGALTVSELSAAGVASILVPFPYAIDDHQTANAFWLVHAGGAIIRQQSELTTKELNKILLDFVEDRERLLDMAKAARAVSLTNATGQCADICLEVARG